MRFVDLNNDILGMIGHKVFLRKLIQHRHNDFHFDKIANVLTHQSIVSFIG